MTTEDIFSYLDTVRKTEDQDPMHRWIGTCNLSVIKIISFYRWLYQPDVHSTGRQTPAFLNNIKVLKRKEKTTCKARDLWTNEEGYSTKSKESNVLKSTICPNCSEPNKPETKFCSKCKMILTYDEYVESLEKQKQKQDRIELLEKRFDSMTTNLQQLIELMSLRLSYKKYETGKEERYRKSLEIVKNLEQHGIAAGDWLLDSRLD